MSAQPCTCGAADSIDDVDTGIIGLPESQLLEGLAKSARLSVADVTRVMFALAHAEQETGNALIAWVRREQLRALRRAKEKSDEKAAAIARAERAAGER